MSVIDSVIFYNIVFAIILFFFKKGERNRYLEYFALLLLVILSVLRFDIGNDYENYYIMINNISQYFTRCNFDLNGSYFISVEYGLEFSFIFFIWLFHKLENTYIYVFAVYSIITIYFWYKTLKANNGLFWGIYTIIVFSILFSSYNVVRQGVGYAIFLYSVQFLASETRNIKKYILYILLAGVFHTSALFLLVLPILKFKKTYANIYVIIIAISYIVSLLGLFSGIQMFIFKNSFEYSGFLENEKQLTNNIGTAVTYTIFIIIYTLLMYRVKKNPLYANLLFIGILLYCISSGNLNINRFAFYFLYIVALAVPYFMRFEKSKFLTHSFIFISLLIFQNTIINGDGNNGCVPYDYVGSENCEKEILRIRLYKLD